MAISRRNLLLILLIRRRRRRNKQFRRWWVHPIFADQKKLGSFYTLYPQLIKDEQKFFNFIRMNKELFQLLLSWIAPRFINNKKLNQTIKK